MPEEIAVIVVISILSGTFLALVKAILNYKSTRRQMLSSDVTQTGASLTTSELEKMIRSAVEASNAELVDRLEALEERAVRQEARQPGLLNTGFEAEEPVPAIAARHRVR